MTKIIEVKSLKKEQKELEHAGIQYEDLEDFSFCLIDGEFGMKLEGLFCLRKFDGEWVLAENFNLNSFVIPIDAEINWCYKT